MIDLRGFALGIIERTGLPLGFFRQSLEPIDFLSQRINLPLLVLLNAEQFLIGEFQILDDA